MNRSSIAWWVAVGLVVVGAGFLLGRGRTTGPPLDPASTDALGTRALVELVEGFDAEVTRSTPGLGPSGDDADVALVLRDHLDTAARDDLLAWVDAGGRLVVADPSSPLGRQPAGVPVEVAQATGACTVEPLAGLGEVRADVLLRYRVRPGEASCFGTADEAWLVARAHGDGSVVLLGGAAPLVNDNLDEGGNAAVVTGLLAPGPGVRIAVVYDAVAGEAGDLALADLIPRRVAWALLQLLVAFAVYVAWRARRFGGVVAEPQPVELPGSLLVQARGELYRRSRSHQRVADQLRRDAEHRIRRQLALGADGPLPLDDIGCRTGLPADQVRRLLVGPAPGGRHDDVVRLAGGLDDLLARLGDVPAQPVAAADPVAPHAPAHDTADHRGADR